MLRLTLVCLASAWPLAATAMTKQQIDCPVDVAPAELLNAKADSLLSGDATEARLAEVQQDIGDIAGACVARTNLPREWRMDYPRFVFVSVLNDRAWRRLHDLGIDPSIIDDAMNIGPHGSNVVMNRLTTEQSAKLAAALSGAGVDPSKLPAEARNLIVAYIAVTSEMYATMAKLVP